MNIVVTGASSGIGEAAAKQLSANGHSLLLSGRNVERLREVAKSCGDAPYVAGDLRDDGYLDQLFETASRIGNLDGAVFAAGIAKFGPSESFSIDDFRATMDTNLTAMFDCCQRAARVMLVSGGGRIVNVLSIASREPFAHSAAYVASKYGGLGLTRSLNAEFRSRGVYFSAVLCGSVDTPLWSQMESHPDRGQMLHPAEVAAAILVAIEAAHGVYEEIVLTPPLGIL